MNIYYKNRDFYYYMKKKESNLRIFMFDDIFILNIHIIHELFTT